MSNNNPIPVRNRAEFFEYMAGFDSSDEWVMLDAAEEFMIKKKYTRGDPYSAVQQFNKARLVESEDTAGKPLEKGKQPS